MKRPTVVVFDIGNVLIPWSRERLFEQVFDDPAEVRYFLDEVYTLDKNLQMDGGMTLDELVDELVHAHPRYASALDVLRRRWRDMLGPPIPGTVALLRLLADQPKSQRPKLYALSNWGYDTYASVKEDFEFFALFDGIVISGEERLIKPAPRIYELMCERYGFIPTDAFFVDDSAANVAGAQQLGFDAVRFESADQLERELVARQLLDRTRI